MNPSHRASVRRLSAIGTAAALALTLVEARAANVAYISSSSGYVLSANGNAAVTASWRGQAPLTNFSGYGLVQWNGRCLAGRTGGQSLTWETCNAKDTAQRWGLSNKRLNNEGGWCADVQGNRSGAGVPVLAFKCSGQVNQQGISHMVVSAAAFASTLPNKGVAAELVKTANVASPGQVISLSTGRVISNDGGSLISNDGGSIVAQGGGNIVAQGGGN